MSVVKFFVILANPELESREPGTSNRSSSLSSMGVDVRLRIVRGGAEPMGAFI